MRPVCHQLLGDGLGRWVQISQRALLHHVGSRPSWRHWNFLRLFEWILCHPRPPRVHDFLGQCGTTGSPWIFRSNGGLEFLFLSGSWSLDHCPALALIWFKIGCFSQNVICCRGFIMTFLTWVVFLRQRSCQICVENVFGDRLS